MAVVGLLILETVESKEGRTRGQAQTRGLEFMVGEIGKSVEGEGVTRISSPLVVSGDKIIVVLEHFGPVPFLFLRRVCFSMFFAPVFEEFGGVKGRGQRQESEKENQRQQL